MLFDTQEAAGTLLTVLTLAVSNAGGIGGGEVLVPLSKILFGFNSQEVVPLCQFLICLGCVTRFLFNYS